MKLSKMLYLFGLSFVLNATIGNGIFHEVFLGLPERFS